MLGPTMGQGASASILLARLVVASAARAGVPAEQLLSAAGLPASTLEDADARVPYAAIQRAWDEALRRTGDEAFALRVAEGAAPGAFRVLDYLGRSSATLREAFGQLERCYRLLHDTVEVHLRETGDEARLVYAGSAEQVPPQAAELALAVALLRGRTLTGVAWVPRAVSFRHPPPRDAAPYLRLFGCPVRFGQEEHALTLDRAHLALPVVSADPTLCAILDRHAEELLARLARVDDFGQQVRRCVAAALRGGEPALERVAAQLHVTPRTLQRRLKELGTTYQQLLDQLRSELATRYLREAQLDISEVAFLLGFSEPSAFHRAFRRWTGTTPRRVRLTRPPDTP